MMAYDFISFLKRQKKEITEKYNSDIKVLDQCIEQFGNANGSTSLNVPKIKPKKNLKLAQGGGYRNGVRRAITAVSAGGNNQFTTHDITSYIEKEHLFNTSKHPVATILKQLSMDKNSMINHDGGGRYSLKDNTAQSNVA